MVTWLLSANHFPRNLGIQREAKPHVTLAISRKSDEQFLSHAKNTRKALATSTRILTKITVAFWEILQKKLWINAPKFFYHLTVFLTLFQHKKIISSSFVTIILTQIVFSKKKKKSCLFKIKVQGLGIHNILQSYFTQNNRGFWVLQVSMLIRGIS